MVLFALAMPSLKRHVVDMCLTLLHPPLPPMKMIYYLAPTATNILVHML